MNGDEPAGRAAPYLPAGVWRTGTEAEQQRPASLSPQLQQVTAYGTASHTSSLVESRHDGVQVSPKPQQQTGQAQQRAAEQHITLG